MMKIRHIALLATLALALSGATAAEAQGKGKGQGGGQSEGKGKGKGQGGGNNDRQAVGRGKGQGNDRAASKGRGADDDRGNANRASSQGKGKGLSKPDVNAGRGRNAGNRFVRVATPNNMSQSVRRYANSRRAQDLVAAAALSHAFARGREENDFRINAVGDGLRIVNLRGDPLVYLDEDRARDLGRWRVGVLDDRVQDDGPSFCRSGAGHPVWGRQWCLDKGFGLGGYEDFRWGRNLDPIDVRFSQPSLREQLLGAALEQVLGTNTYNRLALHAVTLGLVEPLAGTWYTEPSGPQLLRVNSGVYPVAEIVDTNRDLTGDLLLLALRSWL